MVCTWIVRTKGDKRSFARWETFLVSTMHTKIALVACCAGFYNRWVALLGHLLEAKPIAFLLEVIAQTTRSKHTWWSTRHKDTAFFQCLLHYWVCTRVGWASLLLTASWSSSSTRHRQMVNYCSTVMPKPIKRSHERKTMDARACVLPHTVKWKRSHLKTNMQWNWTSIFYWPLL